MLVRLPVKKSYLTMAWDATAKGQTDLALHLFKLAYEQETLPEKKAEAAWNVYVVVFDRRKAVARCPCRHDMEMDETLRPLGKGIEIQRLPMIGRFVVGEKPFAADLRQKLDARSAEQLLKRDREMLCFRLIGIGKTRDRPTRPDEPEGR